MGMNETVLVDDKLFVPQESDDAPFSQVSATMRFNALNKSVRLDIEAPEMHFDVPISWLDTQLARTLLDAGRTNWKGGTEGHQGIIGITSAVQGCLREEYNATHEKKSSQDWTYEAQGVVADSWLAAQCALGFHESSDEYWVFVYGEKMKCWHVLPGHRLHIDSTMSFVTDDGSFYIPATSRAWPYVPRSPKRFLALGRLLTITQEHKANGLTGLIRSDQPLEATGWMIRTEIMNAIDLLTEATLAGVGFEEAKRALNDMVKKNSYLSMLLDDKNDGASRICAAWIEKRVRETLDHIIRWNLNTRESSSPKAEVL